MCGIIGIASNKTVTSNIIQSLKKLEYRGYDSAGIATIVNGNIDEKKCTGRVDNLEKILFKNPSKGSLGIGHVRWATHGSVTLENTHPHRSCDGSVFLVHNGVIENADEIKQGLENEDSYDLSLNEVLSTVKDHAFSSTAPNPNDPLFLHFRFCTNKQLAYYQTGELIKKHFSIMKKSISPKIRPQIKVPDHDETLFAIASDPEASYSSVSIMHKFDNEEDKESAIKGFTTYLATEMLGQEVLKVLNV